MNERYNVFVNIQVLAGTVEQAEARARALLEAIEAPRWESAQVIEAFADDE